MSGRVRLGHNGMAPLPTWAELEPAVPAMVATMRPLLDPDRLHPTPRSVTNADITLRSFAAFLVQAAPDVRSVAEVTRRHVEDYKPFLSERSGQNKPSVRTATLAHRLGTLRMSFVRIDEWGWDEAPVRMPMFPGDRPRRTIRCPRALDDPAAARLLRRAERPQAARPGHRGSVAAHRAVVLTDLLRGVPLGGAAGWSGSHPSVAGRGPS
jgi:hypothetical protein